MLPLATLRGHDELTRTGTGKPNPRRFTTTRPDRLTQDSTECTQTVRKWVEDCISHHPICGAADAVPLPKRILDLGQHDERVFLCEDLDYTTRYGCLSYCWGHSRTVVTTQKTLSHHKQGID